MSWPALASWQWGLGALCAFFVGLAKTGVPGLGILVVPLMALVVGDARQSAGWLLPLLCVADVFGVVYYRRHAHLGRITRLVPWVLAGMVLGAVALSLRELVLRRIVGAIVVVMIAVHLWRKRSGSAAPPQGLVPAVAFGTATGFATTVANAAGPVMNVYLLAQRLPKDEFIGTGAWFFLTVNLIKLPILGAHGLMGAPSLVFDLTVLPALAVGALLGRAVLRWLPQRLFEAVVLVLTTLASLPLLLRG